ncbi:VOC family protein [Cloacibacillus sp.]
MNFTFNHFNFNVLDLGRSLAFYEKALGLKEAHRKERENFTLVYLTDGVTSFELELTYLFDRKEPYDLGEVEFHLAMQVKDFEAVHKLHAEMGCICYENSDMGIYFIEDPDGYWIEIVPER